MSARKAKSIPRFASEDAERVFWGARDSTDYVDWSTARLPAFSNLKPSLRTISIRLPEPMIGHLKERWRRTR